MGSKVTKPAHPDAFGPRPLCLLLPVGSCWWCTFYTSPENQWTDDCPDPPKSIQLSDSNDGHLFVPAGLLEYQGTVYNIEPGICVNNGGTWMAENPPGGCDIPIEAAIHADLSTAVVDSIAARDAHGELAALDNIEHAHFLENLGILTLVVWALCFLMWLWGFFKFVQSKRRAQAGWEKLVRTAGMNVVGKDVNNEGEMVDGIHDKTIEKVNALSHDSQLRLEDV